MAKPTGKQESVKRLADLIRGSHVKPKKDKVPDSIHSTVKHEEGRIESIAKLIKKPSKSVMESGNILDLRREMAQVKARTSEIAGKILEFDGRIQRIDESRNKLRDEIEGLKAQEIKLQEELVSKWQQESDVRGQVEELQRQKREEEIGVGEITDSQKDLKTEYRKLLRELKEAKAKQSKSRDNVRRFPDRITKVEAEIAENLRKIVDFEKRAAMLDNEIVAAKLTLESAIKQQREVAREYDRIIFEKSKIEEAYNIYDGVDRIIRQKDALKKTVEEALSGIIKKQKELAECESQKKALKSALDREDEKQRKIKNDLDSVQSKIRSSESKFSVYGELDEAAKDFNETDKKILQLMVGLTEKAQKIRDMQEAHEKAKKDLQAVIEKEDKLKKKLDDVLVEKQKLEQELSEISDESPKEKLIIELPKILREAIKKETEKINLAQENINELKRGEIGLRDQMVKLKDEIEDLRKTAKAKEKQLVYVKGKIESAGYSEEDRISLKKQIEGLTLEKKEIEAHLNSSDAERRQIKAAVLRIERQAQKDQEAINDLQKAAEDAKAAIIKSNDEMKAARERKIKAWSSSLPLIRVLYPIKARLDALLDEKSKIRAELDEAARLQKKAEADLDSAEKYVEKCRNSMSAVEEEHVELYAQMHAMEKRNNQLAAEKDSLARQLKEEEEHTPLIKSDVGSQSEKLDEIKKRDLELNNSKKQREKSIRSIEGSVSRLQKKLDSILSDIQRIDSTAKEIASRNKELSATLSGENTAIIRALDEKKGLERQLQESRQKQAVIEAEINTISNIYK